MNLHAKPPRPRRLAALAIAALAAIGCETSSSSDPLAKRCGEALEYLLGDWSDVSVAQSTRTGGGLAVRVRVEGTHAETQQAMVEYASCAFEQGKRPAALRVVIGDRTLDAKELALVNAELLLRDLSRGNV